MLKDSVQESNSKEKVLVRNDAFTYSSLESSASSERSKAGAGLEHAQLGRTGALTVPNPVLMQSGANAQPLYYVCPCLCC